MTDFLGIKDDLLELASLSEALDNLVGYVGSEIYRKCQSWVNTLHKISKLLTALELKCKGPLHCENVLERKTLVTKNREHENKFDTSTNWPYLLSATFPVVVSCPAVERVGTALETHICWVVPGLTIWRSTEEEGRLPQPEQDIAGTSESSEEFSKYPERAKLSQIINCGH